MRDDATKPLKLIILNVAAIFVFTTLACRSSKPPTANKAAAAPQSTSPGNTNQSPFDLKESPVIDHKARFTHTRGEHQTRTSDCAFCHQRAGNDVTPAFPGHSACIECHAKDFSSASSQICIICHKTPVNAQGARIAFPAAMTEFGIRSFSHKQHMDRDKMNGETDAPKCGTCHQFSNGISATFPSHQQCYSCHAHQANQKLGECGVCHTEIGLALKYAKGPGQALSLYNFKHGSHLKAASCDKCHNQLEVAPDQTRTDISEINTSRGQHHTSTCWTCHDQGRESTCTKCHRGPVPSV